MSESVFTDNPETGVKQLLCPADVPQFSPGWLSEREAYLISRGWEREGGGEGRFATFRDPKGSRANGELQHIRDLPKRGDDLHKTEPLRQLCIPPASYSFTVEEAVNIQRLRDAAGTGGPTPLERLDASEKRCVELEQRLDHVRGRISMILNANHPSLESVKMALRELTAE